MWRLRRWWYRLRSCRWWCRRGEGCRRRFRCLGSSLCGFRARRRRSSSLLCSSWRWGVSKNSQERWVENDMEKSRVGWGVEVEVTH